MDLKIRVFLSLWQESFAVIVCCGFLYKKICFLASLNRISDAFPW